MPRTPLVNVDASILSSYGPGGTAITIPRSQLKSLVSINVGKMPADAAAALLALHKAVLAAGGDFRVTDCFRSTATQAEARAKYDNWVKAGKPAPGSAGWNSATMKNAFVAPPGRSNHNGGRAIDVHIEALRFPGVAADKQLDKLWELAIPLGWQPVIKEAKEGASESWHFDFLGPWKPVAERAGYESAAIGGAHDVGNGEAGTGGGWQNVQGQLQRAGYHCGTVDGVVGAKTKNALAASGFKGDVNSLSAATAHVEALPNSAAVKWTA
jgi:hypothetical protein